MTRDELKIRTQQIIDAIPVLREKEYGWTEIEKMLNEILIELDDTPWHTGKPTEEGEYICWTIFPKDICRNPEGSWKCNWKNGKWFDAQIDDTLPMDSMDVEVIAWQKIEPYKENEDDRT